MRRNKAVSGGNMRELGNGNGNGMFFDVEFM
jgi:hypothetical protein